MTDHRLIEDSFPVKEIGEEGAKEKNIRHGHISTLHVWWARRPLATSRATAYAALTPAPSNIDEWEQRRDFVVRLSKWENSLNHQLVGKASQEILQANGNRAPRILDPFAGGGSYPLEALRLGCEAYANDYNPVAVLILKATVEYPARFGQPVKGEASSGLFSSMSADQQIANPLLELVKKWGDWVVEETQKELGSLYPPNLNGSIPLGYIWARTITCQNPACASEIPLMRQFWLAQKSKKRVALCPDTTGGKLKFRIVGDGYEEFPSGFSPENGTVSRAVATCLLCGSRVDDKTTRRLFQAGQTGQRMIVVISHYPGRDGKVYRIATPEDEHNFYRAASILQEKREQLMLEWGMEPVPDEPLPIMSGVFNAPIYGMNTWGALFNSRQQLSLITFAEKVRKAHELMMQDRLDPELATAVTTYLGILFDWLAGRMSSLTHWDVTRELISGTFSRQALPMVWDYVEVNPFSGVASGWAAALGWMTGVLNHSAQIALHHPPTPTVSQSSATQLPYPDSYFDAILTDPPYYNSVPYADLSDFFYVWLKRTIGHLHPELFSTPLSPKEKEITEMAGWDRQRYAYKDKAFFEENLKRAFQEIHRVLKPEGIAVIVYAHKSTEGWETVINALLDSNLVVSGAWPLNTEMSGRARAQESATLASSIYIVARKMARQPTGFYNEVREELRRYLNAKLHRLWEEGIGGADFFIAAIGSAIEIFGKYEQVIDYEGNIIRADRLLDDVRTLATDYAVHQILHNGFASEISDLTRFYVLWRWDYGEMRVPFDEARKLAQSCGLDLTQEWGKNGFIRKDKEFVQVLGPQARKLESLEGAHELIDVLHQVLLLWEKGQRTELVQGLTMSGYGQSEAFYRVAQAISETLPNESKEKKLLDGFLAGRERVYEEVGQTLRQPKLWEQ